MKKLLFLLIPGFALAQSPDQNYIKTTIYKDSTQTNKKIQVTYFDGLGRPIQKIDSAQSNSGKDIITHIEYDAFGRQVKDYLPYKSDQSNMFFIAPLTAQTSTANYYQGLYSDNNPFSEKQLEASPLGRVLKQVAPGNEWAMNSGHEIKFDYQTNTSSEVKLFVVTTTWDSTNLVYNISVNSTENYPANQLYKTVTKDENWTSGNDNTTQEFKDKEDRVVLKRTFNNGVAHDTYYVYDIYGNLTYVIPPLADGAFDQNTLDGLCYQYKYDYRNRLAAKKLPGKQWEFIVYDKLDRVVATGPALSPFTDSAGANGWLITKYDAFNRPVLTGWYNIDANATQRSSLQNSVNASTTLSENKTTSATTINGVGFNYTSVAWPTSGYHVLTVSYYDDYLFPHAESIPTTILGQNVYYNNTKKPKGLPTGSWVRATENSYSYKAETSITYYDYKARAIRIKTNNYLTGSTQIDNQFDFIGKILATETLHKRLSASYEILTREEFTYTEQDRLLTHTHQINGGIKQLIVKNTYDELGQIIGKNVGGTDVTGNISLQKVDYNYNIRGWLKEINNIDDLGNDLFAFKIKYNDNETNVNNLTTGEVLVPQLFNGNISETFWVTANDNIKRKYGYEYDNLNRLTFAKFQRFGVNRTNSFDENQTYDKNGNIITLKRNGVNISTYDPSIDDLNYVYHPDNKNQLMKVTDSSLSSSGFKDGSSTGDDYDYDANGNMILDNNKGITSISYNHLNLPVKINYGVNKIEYIYNALGQKLRKTVTENGIISRTDYLGGYQYKSAVLEFFPHAEGYVKNTSGAYSYVFNYTDHLGNIRLSYSDTNQNGLIEKANNEILEENHYYPFGLKHDTSGYGTNNYQPNYKYKYQGQERQDELGLNWDSFKWRNYDYAIGRFMNIDPLAPDFPQWSPYVFSGNLVTISKELEGMEPEFLVQKDGKLTSGVVTLMHAAYGYSVSSLENSTWIISTDERVRNWDRITGHPEASVKGSHVMYSKDVANRGGNYWLGLIGHEQSHRTEVEKEGRFSFYSKYLMQGATRKYGDIDTEATAFFRGSNDKGSDLTDKLLSYKNGAVMDIFTRGNLTNNEKASMLESVGNQFRRDVVLQGNIDGAKSGLENLKDMKMDDKTKANMTNLLNGLIKNWSKEQNDITKKYGR